MLCGTLQTLSWRHTVNIAALKIAALKLPHISIFRSARVQRATGTKQRDTVGSCQPRQERGQRWSIPLEGQSRHCMTQRLDDFYISIFLRCVTVATIASIDACGSPVPGQPQTGGNMGRTPRIKSTMTTTAARACKTQIQRRKRGSSKCTFTSGRD